MSIVLYRKKRTSGNSTNIALGGRISQFLRHLPILLVSNLCHTEGSVQTQKPHISIPETPHYVNALYYLYWTTIRMSTTLEHTSEIISNSSWYCLSFPCRHSSSNHIQNVLNSVICLKSHLRALSFNPAYFAWSKEKKDRQWMMKVNGIKISILKFDLSYQ